MLFRTEKYEKIYAVLSRLIISFLFLPIFVCAVTISE